MRLSLLVGLFLSLGCSVDASQARIDERFGDTPDASADAPPPDGAVDATVDMEPMGPRPSDSCTTPADVADIAVINDLIDENGEAFIQFSTLDLTDRSDVTCAASEGHDAFFKVETRPGEEWHFHLEARTDGRDPSIYILEEDGSSGRCDARTCEQSSNRCGGAGSGDEHFLFIPDDPRPEGATWFLGIDDGQAGGADYQLIAVLLDCTNGVDQHGEGCDGPTPSDDCRQCRRVVRDRPDVTVRELEPNDNVKEANFIEFPPSGRLDVNADLGGMAGCFYPDVFAINVLSGGATLRAMPLTAAGEPCAARSVDVQLELLTVTGESRGVGEIVNMCSVIDRALPEGLTFLQVTDQRVDSGSPLVYQMRFELVE